MRAEGKWPGKAWRRKERGWIGEEEGGSVWGEFRRCSCRHALKGSSALPCAYSDWNPFKLGISTVL